MVRARMLKEASGQTHGLERRAGGQSGQGLSGRGQDFGLHP